MEDTDKLKIVFERQRNASGEAETSKAQKSCSGDSPTKSQSEDNMRRKDGNIQTEETERSNSDNGRASESEMEIFVLVCLTLLIIISLFIFLTPTSFCMIFPISANSYFTKDDMERAPEKGSITHFLNIKLDLQRHSDSQIIEILTEAVGEAVANVDLTTIEICRDKAAICFDVYEEDLWDEISNAVLISQDFSESMDPLFHPKNRNLAINAIYTFINGISETEYNKISPNLFQNVSSCIHGIFKYQRLCKIDEFTRERVEKAILKISFYNKNPRNPSICVCICKDDHELIKILFSAEIRIKLPDIAHKRLVPSIKERDSLVEGFDVFMKCGRMNNSKLIAKWIDSLKLAPSPYDAIKHIRLISDRVTQLFKGIAIITLTRLEFANILRERYPKSKDGQEQIIYIKNYVCSPYLIFDCRIESETFRFQRETTKQMTITKTGWEAEAFIEVINDPKFELFGTKSYRNESTEETNFKGWTELVETEYKSKNAAGLSDLIELYNLLVRIIWKKLKKKTKMKILAFMACYLCESIIIYYKLKEIMKDFKNFLYTSIVSFINCIPLILLIYLISNFPVALANNSEIKLLSINIGKKLDTTYPRLEIEKIWEVEKPDIIFIQEVRHYMEEGNKFSRNGKYQSPKGTNNYMRNDINVEWIAKTAEEVREKKKKKTIKKLMDYNQVELNQKEANDIGHVKNLNNHVSCLILFNEKINRMKINTFKDETMKRYIAIVIETEDKIIILMNVYAPPEKIERDPFWNHLSKEIVNIKREVKKNNNQNKIIEMLLGGDFNSTANKIDRGNDNSGLDKNYIKFLKDLNMVDICRHYHSDKEEYTFERGPSKSRIDHWITTEPLFTHFDTKIHERNIVLSDCHSMIETTMNISTNIEINSEETINISKNYERDPAQLRKIFDKFEFSSEVKFNDQAHDDKQEINRVMNKIISEIKATLEMNLSPCRNNNKGVDESIKIYDSIRARALNLKKTHDKIMTEDLILILEGWSMTLKEEIIIDKTKPNREIISEAIKIIDKLKKKKIYEQERERMNRLIKKCSNSCIKTPLKQIAKKFKKSINKNSKNESIGYVVDEQGVKKGKESIINSFTKFWSHTFEAKQTSHLDFEIDKLEIPHINLISLEEDEYLNLISNLKNNKAPGVDDITNEVYKSLPKKELLKIIEVYKAIWEKEVIPDAWSESEIKLINKGNDQHMVSDYRPIALQNT